jgi:DNA-binding response OmpR family regulator
MGGVFMYKILVVDDDFSVRKSIGFALRGLGYEIFEAGNGEFALECIEKEKPDLVILDIVMPIKEGIETIVEIKDRWADLPIISISGKDSVYLNSANLLGANAILSKPIDINKLIEFCGILINNRART